MVKQDVHQFLGMQQDIKNPEVSSKYIYEGKNIRITSQGDNSLLHITNEKGNIHITDITGLYLGQCIINDYLILFTTGVSTEQESFKDEYGKPVLGPMLNKYTGIDYIYKISLKETPVKVELLYSGTLNFSAKYPIQTLGIYENENIQKVYWIDGLNQPRVINIVNKNIKNNSSFDFVPELNLQESVLITKETTSNGYFSPGVIQYAFSYYNKYGQESNIFYTSELFYLSPEKRGASSEEIVTNSFTINIQNPDINFDYIRIYSIHRTSIDAQPTVKIVGDINLDNIQTVYGNKINLYNKYEYYPNKTNIFWESRNFICYETLLGEGNTPIELDTTTLTPIMLSNPEDLGEEIEFYHFTKEQYPKLVIKVYMGYITWGDATDLYVSKTDDYGEGHDSRIIFTGYKNDDCDFNADTLISFSNYNIVPDTEVLKYKESTIIDTGNTGELIDPTILLYIGGEEIVANAMTHKDNTLFLGNIKYLRPSIDVEIKNKLLLNNYELVDISKQTDDYIVKVYNRKIDITHKDIDSNFYSYTSSLHNGYSAGFKAGEYYRLGLQFQYKNGRWSEPIFIGDIQTPDNVRPTQDSEGLNIPQVEYSLSECFKENDLLSKMLNAGFKKVRPVVVFPNVLERRVLLQGMVCPTIFKLGNRINNAPFAQSSWFVRPYVKYNLKGNEEVFKDNYPERGAWAEFRHFYGLPSSGNSRQEIQGYGYGYDTEVPFEKFDSIICEENYAVDQSIITLHSPDIEWGIGSYNNFNDYSFRIVGFINFTSSIGDIDIQTSSPTISTYAEGFIKRDTYYSDLIHKELYKGKYVNASRSLISGSFYQDGYIRSLEDGVPSVGNIEKFLVYTWHRSGSLNNDTARASSEGTQSAKLLKKVISNLKFSQNNTWLNPPSSRTINNYWTPKDGITIPQLFNSNELSLLSLDSPKREEIQKMNYYGIVDDLVIHNKPYSILYKESSNPDIYKEGGAVISDSFRYGNESVRIKYKSTPHIVLGFNYSNNINQNILPTIKYGEQLEINKVTSEKYPSWMNPSIIDGSIVNSDTITQHVIELVHTKETNSTTNKSEPKIPEYTTGKEYIIYESEDKKTLELWYIDIEGYDSNDDPILSIYYIDSPDHINDSIRDYYRNVIFAAYDETLKKSRYFKFKDLGEEKYEFVELTELSGEVSTAKHIINHDIITLNEDTYNNISDSFLYLAELYRKDIPKNLFGGTTEESLEHNYWIPAGRAVELNKDVTLKYTDGDTWYQRYDCLKTYPFTREDENQVVEIASFMCETRVNADGRYDKNRGQLSNLNMSPLNFNLWNPVYSQKDNFFKYRLLDSDYYKLNDFPNTITWSKEKQSASEIDTWTNITMASTLDLDGDKGKIVSLNTWNNEIYCFQDTGISNIIFNAREQISTASGVPIEISNGNKVNGKRYINEYVGCNNKWSIVESIYGIYFIDNITQGIYLLSNNIKNLSSTLNIGDYIKKYTNTEPWKPANFRFKASSYLDENGGIKYSSPNDFNNFKGVYDKINKKIYFISGDSCLVYSEELGQFESFVDYQNTFSIFNVKNNTYSLYFNSKDVFGDWKIGIWQNNVLDDTTIYNEDRESYVTMISNQDPLNDKIYNTIEFRGNTYREGLFIPKECPFNKVKVWNEYQNTGEINLDFIKNKPSNLKQKFRIWRTNIPRNKGTRDRIRNPWTYVKLINTDSKKFELFDLNIQYFV